MAALNASTILISGAGIAGPALAFWLHRYGAKPTLVEAAPAPREGGYMMDFWGVGYDVAERMGLIPQLRRVGYDMTEVRLVGERGKTVGGFDASVVRAAAGNRFFSIRRGDLARELYRTIENKIETIFGDSIGTITQNEADVGISFRHAAPRRFDLVIGADGLHSTARRLVFGEEEQVEKFLGYYVASFQVANYPHRDEGAYVGYTIPGGQVARYALRHNCTAFLFIWTEDTHLRIGHHDTKLQKAILRERFGKGGWECGTILDALDSCDDLYFDSVSQIRGDSWSHGRVALLGDAAYCPSLLAGQGSVFAMLGAYVLAGELLHANGDHACAFQNYEQRLRPFISEKQRAATQYGGWFAPRTRIGMLARNQMTRLMSLPWIGIWLMRRMIDDRFTLPNY
jgi:2-polyprenyl-6-methoxyphenol hydroxylase-like FAD-dependent oxidoreductase